MAGHGASSWFRNRVVRVLFAGIAALLFLSSTGPLAANAQVSPEQAEKRARELFLVNWITEQSAYRTGDPITPVMYTGDRWTQWFEYARLEIAGVPVEQAMPDDVQLAPVGSQYAQRKGYERWVPEFQPIDEAGEGARYFPETGHSLAHDFLVTYQQPGMAARLGLPISEEFGIDGTTYQFFEYGALAWTPEEGTRELPVGALDAALNGQSISPQPYPDAESLNLSAPGLIELSDMLPGERWIDIDLSEYELTAYVGELPVLTSQVVTGPPQAPTVTGEFEVYLKYRMQSMRGIGWSGEPYFAPDVPWVMYFYQDYAIHGTTWRTTYGYGDGQGCVIPPNGVSELLWNWADEGTRVVVHE